MSRASDRFVSIVVGGLPAPPAPWTDEHDDGSKTYTRAEVLTMVAVVRAQSCGDPDARQWAVTMLDEYDAHE